jgi:hypothetical protein
MAASAAACMSSHASLRSIPSSVAAAGCGRHRNPRMTAIHPRRSPLRTTYHATAAGSGADDDAGVPLGARFQDGDLLSLDFGGDSSIGAAQLLKREWFLEVVTSPSESEDGSVSATSITGICRGRAVTLTHAADASFKLTPAPERAQHKLASQQWLKQSYPEWHALLTDLAGTKRYPRPAGKLPNAGACVGVTKVTSYAELKAEVLSQPGFWCDGTPLGAPPMTPRQQATLNAGEILSTLAGRRGVVMTQLWAGWNDDEDPDSDAALQPVDAPFVTRALREAAEDAAVDVMPAPIGGQPPSKGLTGLFFASQAPYPARAKVGLYKLYPVDQY